MTYVIIRTQNAGVFAGEIENGAADLAERTATLTDARRLWYWAGAASISELAVRGTGKPEACKFPVAVPIVTLTEVIEIIGCTPEGEKSIRDVAEWTAH